MSNGVISHLSLWYESRLSVGVTPTRASGNPNTNLTQVPERAEIDFEDGPTREVTPEVYADAEDPYKSAQFLIERAMHDPDAIVRPIT